MKNAIMLSTHPKNVELIASGRKTLCLTQTSPILGTPCKCYIYQTKQNWIYNILDKLGMSDLAKTIQQGKGMVVGEFICDKRTYYEMEYYGEDDVFQAIYRYTEDDEPECYVEVSNDMSSEELNSNTLLQQSQLSFDEIGQYVCSNKDIQCVDKPFWAWHISELKMYDEPLKINQFNKGSIYDESQALTPLTEPPHSWCYVDSLYKEHIENKEPKLTKAERAFLECTKAKYIVKSAYDGPLLMFIEKPIKYCSLKEWGSNCDNEGSDCISLELFDVKFPFISWEDDEPWSVENLLKLEVKE